MIVRPSGTEAKMKCYLEVITKNEAAAEELLGQLRQPVKEFLS
jgi:phosphomannomutase